MSLVHRPRADLMEHDRDRLDAEPRDDPAQGRRDERRCGHPEPADDPRQREPEAEREGHPDEDLDVIHMVDHCERGQPRHRALPISAPAEAPL